jgi:FKBP-type peptidyl-prolyl cis-trans isomerase FkpA
LEVTDTTVGTGATATAGNTLTVNYTGWLYNASAPNFRGTQFDTSTGKTPFQFKLGVGQVIAGWDQGLVGMRVGGSRTLIIPSSLGYGSAGAGNVIPPDAALVFTVDLLAVQ